MAPHEARGEGQVSVEMVWAGLGFLAPMRASPSFRRERSCPAHVVLALSGLSYQGRPEGSWWEEPRRDAEQG